MPELSAAERRDADAWLHRMMDRPDLHQEGLEAWLKGRPDRRAYYLALQRATGAATSGVELLDKQVSQRFVSSVQRKRPARRIWGPAVSVGLAFAALLVIGISLLPTHGGQNNAVLLATRVGEVRPERLDDGTVVTLDTGTTIDVRMTQGARTVVLRRGRARFIVSPIREAEPLTVIEGANKVIANGATFDVSTNSEHAALVVEGSAEVRLTPAVLVVGHPRSFRLDAGQKLVFSSGQGTQGSVIAARPSDAQWVGGVKSYSEVPIGEVIDEANSYSDTKIVLADPLMRMRLITAELHIRDVEAVAAAVSGFLKLDIDRNQPGKLILTKGN